MYWNPTTRPCPADTPKTWDEWTDVLGQTYHPGDFVAVAVINGRSPQLVIARVIQLNRRNSKGLEHVETHGGWERCEPGASGAKEITRYDPAAKAHVPTGRWHVQTEERRPSCTVKAQPIEDARGFSRYAGKAVTYQFWQNIIRVDGSEFERRAQAAVADLQALAGELS